MSIVSRRPRKENAKLWPAVLGSENSEAGKVREGG
jgi:hypothetical protein